MEFLDEIINMRVKPSDKEKLIQKAKEKHLSVSTYCRIKLVDELSSSERGEGGFGSTGE